MALWDAEKEGYETPYDALYAFTQRHSDSGTAYRIAKLILSLYDYDNGFSVAECLASTDSDIQRLMVLSVAYYAGKGEDEALRRVGKAIYNQYPGTAALGEAIRNAVNDFRDRRDRERGQQEDD